MRISSTGATCACGAVGCLETWMSAPALQARFLAATGADQAPSADRIVEFAMAGDPVAVAVWNDAIDALAFGLLNATMLLDPGLIVVGGGMSLAGAALFDRLRGNSHSARPASRSSLRSGRPSSARGRAVSAPLSSRGRI